MESTNKKNQSQGKVLPAQDNAVQGASEGNLAVKTPETAAGTVYSAGYLAKLRAELGGTKSAVIRRLSADGLDHKTIHKVLKDAGWKSDKNPGEPIRYQHVRNVLTQQVKKPVTAATSNSTATSTPATNDAAEGNDAGK